MALKTPFIDSYLSEMPESDPAVDSAQQYADEAAAALSESAGRVYDPTEEVTSSDASVARSASRAEDAVTAAKVKAHAEKWKQQPVEAPASDESWWVKALNSRYNPFGWSPVKKTLHVLQAPMYAGAAVVKKMAGMEPDRNVLEAVKEGVESEQDYISLLQQAGLGGKSSAALGLVADVALDPVNWMTAGTSALVPKVAKGAQKAGAEGVKKAARAYGLKAAESALSGVGLVTGATRKVNRAEAAVSAMSDAYAVARNRIDRVVNQLSSSGGKASELVDFYESKGGMAELVADEADLLAAPSLKSLASEFVETGKVNPALRERAVTELALSGKSHVAGKTIAEQSAIDAEGALEGLRGDRLESATRLQRLGDLFSPKSLKEARSRAGAAEQDYLRAIGSPEAVDPVTGAVTRLAGPTPIARVLGKAGKAVQAGAKAVLPERAYEGLASFGDAFRYRPAERIMEREGRYVTNVSRPLQEADGTSSVVKQLTDPQTGESFSVLERGGSLSSVEQAKHDMSMAEKADFGKKLENAVNFKAEMSSSPKFLRDLQLESFGSTVESIVADPEARILAHADDLMDADRAEFVRQTMDLTVDQRLASVMNFRTDVLDPLLRESSSLGGRGDEILVNAVAKDPSGVSSLGEVLRQAYDEVGEATPSEAYLKDPLALRRAALPELNAELSAKGKRAIDPAALEAGTLSREDYGHLYEFAHRKASVAKAMHTTLKAFRSDVMRYDRVMASLVMRPRARAVLRSLDAYYGLFRSAVLGGSAPASTVTQALSNFFAMHGMAGFDVASSAHLEATRFGYRLAAGFHDPDMMRVFHDAPEVLAAIRHDPALFRQAIGVAPLYLHSREAFLKQVVEQPFRKFPSLVRGDTSAAALAQRQASELYDIIDSAGRDVTSVVESIRNFEAKHPGIKLERWATAAVRDPDFAGIHNLWANGIVKDWARQASERSKQGGGLLWKALDGYFNKLGWAFSLPDTASRAGAWYQMTTLGLSRAELTKFARNYRLLPEEVKPMLDAKGSSVGRFRIDPIAAARVTREMHVDFDNAPKAVRVMQKLPVVGVPFASFSVALAQIAYNAAKSNPSYFNRMTDVGKAVSSFTGGPVSPDERMRLEDPANAEFTENPALWRMVVGSNPIYVNMSTMLPFYSMSLLDGRSRAYQTETGKAISRLVDQSPVLNQLARTPEGRVIMDYYILPLLTNESLSEFGVNVPSDAGPLDRLRLAARDVIGAVIPNTASVFAPGVPGLAEAAKDPDFIDYWVPTYRARALLNAMNQRTAGGLATQSSVGELVGRQLMSMGLGITYRSPSMGSGGAANQSQ